MKRLVAMMVTAAMMVTILGNTAAAAAPDLTTSNAAQFEPRVEEAVSPRDDLAPVEADGLKSGAIKASIRVIVRFLRNNVDEFIERLVRERTWNKTYLNYIRRNADRLANALEELLEWEDVALTTVYDHIYRFLINSGISHDTAHWVALAFKWGIQWGLF